MDTRPPQTRNLSVPDETLTLEKGSASTVRLGEMVVGRLVLEPGWRWSEHVRPTAGTTIPPGHDNWVVGDEPLVAVLWGGWRGWGKPPVGERVLTTMLMTDIAGSTDRVSAVGDAVWDQLLDRHNTLVREILERYRGTEIDTAGDGFLTMFDGAARAVQAALEIRAAVRGIGLDIRVGLHTGEVEVVPGGIRGLGVHETARIMALGDAGDVLVSSTTRELSAGSGFRYVDRGIHHLKGIPASRHVFQVVAAHEDGREG